MTDIPIGEIQVRILEAIPIRLFGSNSYLLSLQIIDGEYKTPIVRKELKSNESLAQIIREFVEMYKVLKPIFKEEWYAGAKR